MRRVLVGLIALSMAALALVFSSVATAETRPASALAQIPAAVTPQAAVWGVSSTHAIFRLDAGGHWVQVPGTLIQLAVTGSGQVWGVNSGHSVYRYAGAGKWTRMPGTLSQIASGSNDDVWGVNPTHGVYQYAGAGKWTRRPGSLLQLSIGGDGTPWGINTTHQVVNTTQWSLIHGTLAQVSAGGDGSVCGVNASQAVFCYAGQGNWSHLTGSLVQVAVGGDGSLWGLNSHHAIYRYGGSSWQQVAGSLVQIAVGGRTDTLTTGRSLRAGGATWSSDGKYELAMQHDGNLAVYGPSGANWASSTGGTGDDSYVVVQGDGNLVVYNASNQPTWSSSTNGSPNDRLVVQADGNLVLYSVHGAVWSSFGIHSLTVGMALDAGGSIHSPNGSYTAKMQVDGNFVVTGPSGQSWASGTSGSLNWVVMQGDGNLVVYTAANQALWASQTSGANSSLSMQDDGNLVVYAGDGHATWNSFAASGGPLSAAVDAFVAKWNGVPADYWGTKSYQCVDLFNFYDRDVVHTAARPHVDYAFQLYNTHDTSKYTQLGPNATPQKGDVAVWSSQSAGSNGAGHVAIVLSSSGNTLTIFTQNPGASHIGTMTTTNLLGYLRPIT